MKSEQVVKLPFYVKATVIIIGIFALFTIAYIAKGILIPVVFSVIMAILLNPVVNLLKRIVFNRVIAILITLLFAFVIIAAFSGFLVTQFSRFAESWPSLAVRVDELINNAVNWISGKFDISEWSIHDWIDQARKNLLKSNVALIGSTITTFGSAVVTLLLIPVYIFLFIFYNSLILEFFKRVFAESQQYRVGEVITQIKSLIQSYLLGLLMEIGIIAVLEITALTILGIQYAVLLGIIGALLNLIPYIGAIIAAILPMIVALATKSSAIYVVYVMIAYYTIQMVDNNIIVPRIVASKVKINALFSILVVIVGNAMWGIPGMFLAIPLLAIIKLIFDNIDPLKPWGYLLGDSVPNYLIKFRKMKTSVPDKDNETSYE